MDHVFKADFLCIFFAASSVDINGFHITMLPNPSHLEAVNPVAMGKTRARHMSKNGGDYDWINSNSSAITENDSLCVLVHGDAAFSGQGINQESLMLSYLPHYNVGGTIHLVVNNQVSIFNLDSSATFFMMRISHFFNYYELY